VSVFLLYIIIWMKFVRHVIQKHLKLKKKILNQMRKKIVNYHFERIKCVLEGKRLLDDELVFPSYVGFTDNEIIKVIIYYIKNSHKLYYADIKNTPYNYVWKRQNIEIYNLYLFNYYIFVKKTTIINKILKKELPFLTKKYYYWLGLYITSKYILKLSDIKTYIYVIYLQHLLKTKFKDQKFSNLHKVYKYSSEKGMLKNFDKNYKIIDKNAGKIFKIIKKMYKTCLDDKQYAKYVKREGKYYDFPSNINYYLDRLPEYSDKERITKEVKKKLGLK